MKLRHQAFVIAALEYGFLRRFPRLWVAAAVTALIYLSSVWNPGAHS